VVQELRPRGVGEILDVAVALYRERFGALMKVSAIFVVPLALFQMFVFLSALPDDYTFANNGMMVPQYNGTEEDLLNSAAILVTLLVTTLATTIVTAASTKIVAGAYTATPETSGAAIKTTFRRLWGIVLVAGVTLLVVGFCPIAGYFIAALWTVALPVLILEHAPASQALRRSFELTKPHYGLTLGVYWGSTLLVNVLTVGSAGLLTLFIFRGDHSPAMEVVTQSVSFAVASVFMTPFAACAAVALYFDLRIRNEAYDVQAMIARLDRRQADSYRA
jgi:hypothetical protein